MADWILQVQSLQVDLPLQGGGALRVLNGIDLKVERGAFVAILGPSGSGKTTLLRAIAGLITPRAGSVTVRTSRDGKQHLLPSLSMNFQRPVLLPWLNVRDNALLPYRIHRLPICKEVEDRLNELLAMVGLFGFRTAMPHELSGGMQMRAALVRSFMTTPEIVLMDEPFAALDEVTRHRLGDEVLQLWRRDTCTILFVTHNIQEAAYLADRVVVLSRRPARITEEVTVPLLRPRVPAIRESRAYFDFINMLYGCMGHD
jgi:NitT/TauT family transport system ATP-binding protein